MKCVWIAAAIALAYSPISHSADPTIGGKTAGEKRNFAGIPFHWCPKGEFTMGSPKEEKGHEENEVEVVVKFPTGFWLQETEVTREQYVQLMNRIPWNDVKGPQVGASFPAEDMTWSEAITYCDRLTGKLWGMNALPRKWKCSLPTEAEWEYGCRAGTSTAFSFGNDSGRLGEFAWFADNAHGKSKPVGTKSPNAWKLYDMHGNVREWCLDEYQPRPVYGVPQKEGLKRAIDTSKNESKPQRGGSNFEDAGDCRSACRVNNAPSKGISCGFRVAIVEIVDGDAIDGIELNP